MAQAAGDDLNVTADLMSNAVDTVRNLVRQFGIQIPQALSAQVFDDNARAASQQLAPAARDEDFGELFQYQALRGIEKKSLEYIKGFYDE